MPSVPSFYTTILRFQFHQLNQIDLYIIKVNEPTQFLYTNLKERRKKKWEDMHDTNNIDLDDI